MVVFTTVTQQGGGEDKSQEFEPPYGPLMVRLWSLAHAVTGSAP